MSTLTEARYRLPSNPRRHYCLRIRAGTVRALLRSAVSCGVAPSATWDERLTALAAAVSRRKRTHGR